MKRSLAFWYLPLIPLIAKLIMTWSGKDHPGNFWWIFFCRLEIVLGVMGLVSLGICIGWKFGGIDHTDFHNMKHEHMTKLNEHFYRFQNEHVPLREELVKLKCDLDREKWRHQLTLNQLEEEKKKVTRTPEQANAEALKKVMA